MRGGKARLFREGLASAAVANGREGFGDCRAFLEPVRDSVPIQPESGSPLAEVQGHAIVGETNVIRSVVLLDGHCSPSAITGLIAPIVIDPVDGHAGGFLAHVGQKSLETVSPLIANSDASATL